MANIFLVQVNASEYDYVFDSIKKIVKDKVLLIINISMLLMATIIIYTPVNKFLKLTNLNIKKIIFFTIIVFIAVFWYEIVKLIKKINTR